MGSRSLGVAALMICLVIAHGCSPSSSTTGALTTPVRGKIVLNGKPLSKGTITFEPEGPGKDASGEIQPDGTFVMTTYKKDDGTVLGKHRVSINFTDKLVPVRYKSFATSKVEVDVTEAQAEYPIELQ